MIKKMMALAATALFSLNASAGYIQYNFNGPIQGYVVQHDDDQSIAFYNLNVPVSGLEWPVNLNFHPIFGEGADVITSETTYFRKNGPTNFSIFDDFGGDRSYGLSMDFSRGTGGNFAYTADFGGSIYMGASAGNGFYPFSGKLTGTVAKGIVDAGMAHMLDTLGGYYDGVPDITPKYIGPGQVPEPASLALLAIGALGAAGAARGRKTVR